MEIAVPQKATPVPGASLFENEEEDKNTHSPTPGLPSDDECENEILRAHGLLVNPKLQILVCPSCEGIVDPHRIRRHFSRHHPNSPVAIDLQEQFNQQVLSIFPNLTANPPFPSSPLAYIPHLSIVKRYLACASCNRCYSNDKNFKSHGCKQPTSFYSHAQRFRTNPSNAWFAVSMPPPVVQDETPW